MKCKRGDIFYADMGAVIGSEQGGVRPFLIIQNDTGNKHSPTVIGVPITSQTEKSHLPTHVKIVANEYGLQKNSIILCEQIKTLDKRRLQLFIGHMSDDDIRKVDGCLLISLGLKI